MPAETSEGQEIETTDTLSSTKINDFDENVSPSDLVEPENALPAITKVAINDRKRRAGERAASDYTCRTA